MLYMIIKWVHVLAAITAIGANITYGIWIARASRSTEALPFTLRGIKLIDDRVANPAYVLSLITGVLMIFVGELNWTTPWLLTSLGLYLVLVILGLFGYSPVLKRQIRVIESEGAVSPAYQALAGRSTILGIALVVLAIMIVFLMVVKPPLWG